jgi:two-component system, chemotaxis family, protein-glutamate methylesterase/glutaminase
MIKVFVIDDSAVVRQAMAHLLSGDPALRLQGSAPNPIIAAPMIRKERPDVLLLDIEMPGMDGLTFLRQQMAGSAPIPTVICSTLTTEGSRMAVDALASGAVSVVAKPRLGLRQFLEDSRRQLAEALRVAARSRPRTAHGPRRQRPWSRRQRRSAHPLRQQRGHRP